MRTWYRRHVALDSRRSSTWTSGAGTAQMVAAVCAGAETWPASVTLAGEYGIDGVSLIVPAQLGPTRVHEWELAPDELAGLHRAADAVRSGRRGAQSTSRLRYSMCARIARSAAAGWRRLTARWMSRCCCRISGPSTCPEM